MYKFFEITTKGEEYLAHIDNKEHLKNQDLKNIYNKLQIESLRVLDVSKKETFYIGKKESGEISIFK